MSPVDQRYKAVTVFHPPGKVPHAVVGYIGLWGALTGMSQAGLTVHEANLEEKQITFAGFPWLLRLRYIMENARNNAEAKVLWLATNNTVGFNHMTGSASDAEAYAKATEGSEASAGVAGASAAMPAMVMETMYNYTAFFNANDPREANATYANASATAGAPVRIGFPLGEAVWRTNHGYDPVIRANYLWSQAPNSWYAFRFISQVSPNSNSNSARAVQNMLYSVPNMLYSVPIFIGC